MIVCIILGIINILYGVAIMRVASGTLFFGVWYVIGLLFIALGLAIHAKKLTLIPQPLRIALLAVAACGIIVLCVTTVLIGTHMNDKGRKGLDYVIVLGAQVKPGSTQDAVPSTVLRYRLDAAASYLKENPDTVCIVSGGKSSSEPEPEADVMKRYLIGRGIDADYILVENRSMSTTENIRNSREIIDGLSDSRDLSVGIVTNNFHVYRACAIARRQYAGKDITIDGIAAYSPAFYLPNNMLRESAGIVKDFLYRNL